MELTPVSNETLWVPIEEDHIVLEHINLTFDPKRVEILEIYRSNTFFNGPTLFTLLSSSALFILLGVIGNFATLKAITRSESMRTPRNIFIANLAISDILLCVSTQPTSLLFIVTVYWPQWLRQQEFLCKFVSFFQIIPLFVSTFSMTAIITHQKFYIHRKRTIFLTIFGIWTASIILSTPAYIWTALLSFEEALPELHLDRIEYCIDEWPMRHGPMYNAVFIGVFHYALPITVICAAYSVFTRLPRSCFLPGRREINNESYLFLTIGILFWMSWLPSHAIHIVLMYVHPDYDENYEENQVCIRIIYAGCELIGMISPICNPFFYGWFDQGFRKEFRDMGLLRIGCGGWFNFFRLDSREEPRAEEEERQERVQYWKETGTEQREEDYGDGDEKALI